MLQHKHATVRNMKPKYYIAFSFAAMTRIKIPFSGNVITETKQG